MASRIAPAKRTSRAREEAALADHQPSPRASLYASSRRASRRRTALRVVAPRFASATRTSRKPPRERDIRTAALRPPLRLHQITAPRSYNRPS